MVNIDLEKIKDVKIYLPVFEGGEWTIRLNGEVNLNLDRENLEYLIDVIQEQLIITKKKEAV